MRDGGCCGRGETCGAKPARSKSPCSPSLLRDRADVARLVADHERDRDAVAARAAGAARAVHVAVLVLGRVEVDDVGDVGDVDAAGGDVGRDERVDVPALERGERALALVLGLVAVQRQRLDAARAEALDEPVGAALGADEDEREAAVALELVDERVELGLVQDLDEAVLDLRGLLRGRPVGVVARLAGVVPREVAGGAGERGREQQRLAPSRACARRCARGRGGSPCPSCGRPRRGRGSGCGRG